jgi:hypothetical protein
MISELKEQRIAEMLTKDGFTLRGIAAIVGVSHDTVRRRKYGYLRRKGISREMVFPGLRAKPRCPTCGAALEELPCRACQLRTQLGGESQ